MNIYSIQFIYILFLRLEILLVVPSGLHKRRVLFHPQRRSQIIVKVIRCHVRRTRLAPSRALSSTIPVYLSDISRLRSAALSVPKRHGYLEHHDLQLGRLRVWLCALWRDPVPSTSSLLTFTSRKLPPGIFSYILCMLASYFFHMRCIISSYVPISREE